MNKEFTLVSPYNLKAYFVDNNSVKRKKKKRKETEILGSQNDELNNVLNNKCYF